MILDKVLFRLYCGEVRLYPRGVRLYAVGARLYGRGAQNDFSGHYFCLAAHLQSLLGSVCTSLGQISY